MSDLNAHADFETPEPIGVTIKRLRRRRGMSQDTLARTLARASNNPSVNREIVARWERGRRVPGPYWRNWLGQVLGVPAHELELAAAAARFQRVVHELL